MKRLFITFAAALTLGACGNAVDTGPTVKTTIQASADKVVATKTKAVLVYASWCGSCKVLDPAVKKVQEMGPLPGLEFVVLDFTDKNEESFYAQAEAAGVKLAVSDYLNGKVKTGQLLLVDIDDQTVIDTATKADTAPTILAKIKSAISAS